ncbi:MAG: PHB depolymerase family esterase [Pseudomonadota bacterium]
MAKSGKFIQGAALFGLALMSSTQKSTALEEVTDFGSNPGELKAYVHRPENAPPGMPLVVAMHGCTQNAESFARETGLISLSEETPFLLLLPQQNRGNMERLCFRWHDSGDNRPGRGESASLLQIIETVTAAEDVDPEKVFVMGLSAGAGMTAVLLANYPDRFSGGAMIAGPPYNCNQPGSIWDMPWRWIHYNPFSLDGADAAYACGLFTSVTTDRDPEDWARFVFNAAETVPDNWPVLSIWQGDADQVVDPDNLEEMTEQWTAVHDIDLVVDDEQTVGQATRRLYQDDAGKTLVEAWDVSDLGHSVPVDVDGSATCGQVAEHTENVGLCSVRLIADFWGLR